MAVGIVVTITDHGVRRMMEEALRHHGDLRPVLDRLGLYMVRDAGRRLRRRSGSSDDHTGRLRASLTFRSARDSLTVGSPLKYAAVQQLGHPGIRSRRRGGFLAIPLQPHLRRRSVWPSDLPKDQLHLGGFSKRGNRLLIGPDDQPWYVLVKEVKIEVDPYLVFDRAAESFLRNELIAYMGLN